MSEFAHEPTPRKRYESPLHVPWKITNQEAMRELTTHIATKGQHLADPPVAFRGGAIMAPNSVDLAPGYSAFLSSERSMAVIPVTTEQDGKLTDVVHFPTKKESTLRFDANLAAYKKHVGDYLDSRWDVRTLGKAPLPGVTSIDTLSDGRYVTTDKYQPYLKSIGRGAGSMGIHQLDTQNLAISDTAQLVRTLDALHPSAKDFYSWMHDQSRMSQIPKESLLNTAHPLTAMRGQEWWINPTSSMDRLRELQLKSNVLAKQFRALDPTFNATQRIQEMIKNNLPIFPHQNGHVDSPSVAGNLAIVHGALYPGNIHRSQNPDRTVSFTVTGGDRSHIGLPAESVDWLIATAANSPVHQEALISEFLKLHPSDTDKRGLAMHVLYRSLSESPWIAAHGTPQELNNLAKLSYDILNGNGVWKGANAPLK